MIKIHTLNSGVKLIMDKMESVKSVSIGIWCNNGSQNERPEENGISHCIEHMMFKGTPTRNAYQIVKEMDSLGADINAFTSKQRTCYYAKCISDKLFECCDVLTDMIEHPLFDDKELEREKLVIIEEINMNADDPDDVAMETFDQSALTGSTLAMPVIGTKETVKSFNHDILARYYEEHYTRDKLVVSLAGCFDETEVIKYFEQHFLNLPLESRDDDFGIVKGVVDNIRIEKDIEQAHLVLGTLTVPVNDPRRHHMSILSTIIGGGMSSRLFQNVREKKGLAYSVYSSNSFYSTAGEFGIVAGVAKDRVDEAIAAIKEEIDRLAIEPISEDEFNTAKTQLISSYTFGMEATQTRMRTNGANYFNYGFCHEQDDVYDIISSITLEDIEETKKLISDFSKYTIVNVTGR